MWVLLWAKIGFSKRFSQSWGPLSKKQIPHCREHNLPSFWSVKSFPWCNNLHYLVMSQAAEGLWSVDTLMTFGTGKAQCWGTRVNQQNSWSSLIIIISWSAITTKRWRECCDLNRICSSCIFCERWCYVILHLVASSDFLLHTGMVDSGYESAS